MVRREGELKRKREDNEDSGDEAKPMQKKVSSHCKGVTVEAICYTSDHVKSVLKVSESMIWSNIAFGYWVAPGDQTDLYVYQESSIHDDMSDMVTMAKKSRRDGAYYVNFKKVKATMIRVNGKARVAIHENALSRSRVTIKVNGRSAKLEVTREEAQSSSSSETVHLYLNLEMRKKATVDFNHIKFFEAEVSMYDYTRLKQLHVCSQLTTRYISESCTASICVDQGAKRTNRGTNRNQVVRVCGSEPVGQSLGTTYRMWRDAGAIDEATLASLVGCASEERDNEVIMQGPNSITVLEFTGAPGISSSAVSRTSPSSFPASRRSYNNPVANSRQHYTRRQPTWQGNQNTNNVLNTMDQVQAAHFQRMGQLPFVRSQPAHRSRAVFGISDFATRPPRPQDSNDIPPYIFDTLYRPSSGVTPMVEKRQLLQGENKDVALLETLLSKNSGTIPDDLACITCCEMPRTVFANECGCKLLCVKCANALIKLGDFKCPQCRIEGRFVRENGINV